ncbi:hypothetical protein GWI33_019198 [Rhynchophorus ferrugineus]|uniref:Uncharacterized protein n=1 Tax=Rhynchophorus ferrugineus TaxID=354439 RepID=A0A834M5J5_RHYFE|nr:hypothetical protein GWI33_019198 [Rhynchophorus ferrugineus]
MHRYLLNSFFLPIAVDSDQSAAQSGFLQEKSPNNSVDLLLCTLKRIFSPHIPDTVTLNNGFEKGTPVVIEHFLNTTSRQIASFHSKHKNHNKRRGSTNEQGDMGETETDRNKKKKDPRRKDRKPSQIYGLKQRSENPTNMRGKKKEKYNATTRALRSVAQRKW